jgi:hypothetical protein
LDICCCCNPIANTLCGTIAYFTLYNIAFIAYVEKYVKGILIRPDSNGDLRMVPTSLLNFLVQPLNIRQPEVFKSFWTENLDINYANVSFCAWAGKFIFTSLFGL